MSLPDWIPPFSVLTAAGVINVKDIAALALNRLAPHYTVIEGNREQKQKEAEEKYASEVTGALVQAILVVKRSRGISCGSLQFLTHIL